MYKIKKGDIVGRISYNKDIIFIVKDISDKKNVLLEGVFERIIADSDISDLEPINKKELVIQEEIKNAKIRKKENRLEENAITGKILHLDGDNIFIYILPKELNTTKWILRKCTNKGNDVNLWKI